MTLFPHKPTSVGCPLLGKDRNVLQAVSTSMHRQSNSVQVSANARGVLLRLRLAYDPSSHAHTSVPSASSPNKVPVHRVATSRTNFRGVCSSSTGQRSATAPSNPTSGFRWATMTAMGLGGRVQRENGEALGAIRTTVNRTERGQRLRALNWVKQVGSSDAPCWLSSAPLRYRNFLRGRGRGGLAGGYTRMWTVTCT